MQDDDPSAIARRALLKLLALGAAGAGVSGSAEAQTTAQSSVTCASDWPMWRSGVEGQRRADLGNGHFLNPVMPGDHADPTILKDGDDYYMTYSSFLYYPAIVIWHSRDLVNWTPIDPALKKWIGSIYALDLIKHDGRYFIYIPALGFYIDRNGQPALREGLPPVDVYVIHADNIAGPWSDPIRLGIQGIDPGHAVGEDGKRYLFVNDGRRVRLTDDGLATDGPIEKVYDGWHYPADWIVEGYALEGPKMLQKDGWHYMFSAVGGTAGPPTSHMVIVARARSLNGPWENCPHNPIVRTQSINERWWSRGHATPVQGPGGDWWLLYHGYENGFRTLGRQTLLDPMEWDRDGWPRARGGDLARPLSKPLRSREAAGQTLSDDFTRDTFGTRLALYNPNADYLDHIRIADGALTIDGYGTSPNDCPVLAFIAGDHSYEVSVEVELTGDGEAGLLLFYAPPYFTGLGFSDASRSFYNRGSKGFSMGAPPAPGIGRRFHLRVVNDLNVASFYYSTDGVAWTLENSAEVAGYNHNVANGFLSLRPAIYKTDAGQARFRNLRYAARP